MPIEFDIPLLQAISDWQRGGDSARRGLRLKEACSALPDEYRTSHLGCFRQIALEKGSVWDLIGENRLAEKVSSWTFDSEVAKAFKSGVPPQGQGYQGVIFFISPPPKSIIVNLWKLYQDCAFVEAMEKNKTAIIGYSGGAGRYKGSQNEIVLEIDTLTQEDIYSLGGHSSEFEYLVGLAADEIYQRPATPEEKEDLLWKSEHVRKLAGPQWLTQTATKRVLARTKPQAEILVGIKRQQASSAQ